MLAELNHKSYSWRDDFGTCTSHDSCACRSSSPGRFSDSPRNCRSLDRARLLQHSRVLLDPVQFIPVHGGPHPGIDFAPSRRPWLPGRELRPWWCRVMRDQPGNHSYPDADPALLAVGFLSFAFDSVDFDWSDGW